MATEALRRLDDAVGRGEDIFLAAAHGVIAALVIAAIVFRYGLNSPLIWTEEFIVIVFTWMLFVGLASAFRHRMHIRIDALLIMLPHRGRAAFGIVAVAATAVTLCALTWFGAVETWTMLETQTPMMRISAAWAVSAVPIGAGLSCLHLLRHALCDGFAETLWPADLVGSAEGEV
jgi:TRAP-type C4-dicarboxylate transport system permease small subunit